MKNDRGSMTVWAMGLSLLLFAVGFLALDLWSGFAARQQAAAIADSAAIAGATAVDENAWRSGTLALDAEQAQARAHDAALTHPAWEDSMTVSTTASPEGVTVAISRTIPFRYISGLVPDQVAEITVTAYAEP
ncbi:MAG: pilus assembly protein TadG-related protein, partial [Actinomycetota bacterium]